MTRTQYTGCPKKNALLSLKAYNSGLEAAIWASRDSFGILRLWAFIWDQEVQDYVKASLRKMHLKLATLSQNLTLLYHRYSPLRMSCSVCVMTKSQRLEPNLTGVDTIISLATSHSQALTIHHLKTRILSTAWHYWAQVLFPHFPQLNYEFKVIIERSKTCIYGFNIK